MSSFIDGSLIGLIGAAPLLAQVTSASNGDPFTEVIKLGGVGAFAALALWSLRNESSERIEDHKTHAEQLAAERKRSDEINEQRIREQSQGHEAMMGLVMRLLEREREGKKE